MVPWARLRAWIDEKEAYENKHGQPAHLTDRELAAISQLVPFYKDDEPDVGVEDHVSDLMREF